MINKNFSSDKFASLLIIPELDDQAKESALRLFRSYKDSKVIYNCVFSDDKWFLTDEYELFGFNFVCKDNKMTEVQKIYKMTCEQMMEKLKIYILFKMGKLQLKTLQAIIAQVKYVVMSDIENIENLPEYHGMTQIEEVCEFFGLLQVDDINEQLKVIEALEYLNDRLTMNKSIDKRTLPSFDSFFKFDSILNKFWETASEDEKIFFFPVYFWWSLTSVIPTRPREYLLTPRKCLKVRNGQAYLTIRKNNLKGSRKNKNYKISKDYKNMEIAIPKKMEETIQWYINATSGYDDNDLHTLLIPESHYSGLNKTRPYTSRFFTYNNMSTCLKLFFETVVCNKFNYNIVFDRDSSYLSDDEINFIHLGDLRHLALINLIEEGAAPVVAMLLAGQEAPEVSAHYYSNISKLIECRIYRQYKKMVKGGEEYAISHFNTGVIHNDEPAIVDGGYCWSDLRKHNDFSDCMKIMGENGEIGDCRACRFFRSSGHSFYDNADWHKKRIEAECKILAKIVEDVRKEKGCKEDIIAAINRIRTENYSYEQYCLEKEIQNGKTKEN